MTRKPTPRTVQTSPDARQESLDRLRAIRPPVNIRLRSGQTAELMAMAMALQASLRAALEELAVVHGCTDGPWLDELEKTMFRDASNIWADGLPIDAELRAMDSGRALVQALTNALRAQLSAP
ncbi:hypothetical protein [Neomesorhizobium albiziae]|uniref:hypothetical protein n=1 Tax=Neomesorhizobium albiziae TaxID=335020 RepID=UPI00122D0F9A|nr:hypothetical protein [Mesorhizobium albiziae]